MVARTEIFSCPGHISREHFLDLIEEDGFTCDLDDVIHTYCVPFITYEGTLYPVGLPGPVTVVLRASRWAGRETSGG